MISILNGTHGQIRIARQPRWTPAHTRLDGPTPGKKVGECIKFAAMANDKNGRKDSFRYIAWGGYARTIALCGSIGLEMTVNVTPQSYLGRVFDQNNNLVLRPDGQPMLVEKVNFRIDLLGLGDESAKHIAEQIQHGKRPPHWNVAGHADKALWEQISAARRAHRWSPGETNFGCAVVDLPNYQYQLISDAEANGAGAAPGTGAIVNPGTNSVEQAVHQVSQNLPAGQAPVQQPVQPQQMSGQQMF